jgi:hypothetical protein
VKVDSQIGLLAFLRNLFRKSLFGKPFCRPEDWELKISYWFLNREDKYKYVLRNSLMMTDSYGQNKGMR